MAIPTVPAKITTFSPIVEPFPQRPSKAHAAARSLGAAAVLDKPFDVDELRATVRQLAPLR